MHIVGLLLRATLLVLGLLLAPELVSEARAQAGGAGPTGRSAKQIDADLRFAGEMATQGLWREALFRWERVLRDRPEDARVWNNVAVAAEALGDFEKARAAFQKSAALSGERQIQNNWLLFQRARRNDEAAAGRPSDAPAAPNPAPASAPTVKPEDAR